MKTWLKIIALAILLSALAGYFLAPRLIKIEQLQPQVTAQLAEKLGQPVQVASARWYWLPLPHLSLYHTSLHYEAADFILPEVRLYPKWLSLFGSGVEVGKIVLKKPEVTLRIRGDFSETPPEFTLPKLKIAIDDGILHVQSLEPIFGVVARAFDLTDITASAKLAPEDIAFKLKAASTFSKAFKMKGRYSFKEKHYSLETVSEEMKLHKAILSTAHGTLIPVDSVANFKTKISGIGTTRVSADIRGDLPRFLYKPKKQKVLLDSSLIDLHLDKVGDDLTVVVNDLTMEHPGLHLQGSIKRTVAAAGAEPIWQLNLVGKDLDVTEIRRAALALFGDNVIVKDLFDIVRGGMAKAVTYAFKGRTIDFEYLEYQTITAEAANAVVHIPDVKLTLEGVNGRMRIDEGTLFVSEANGRLGQSKGRNCALQFTLLDHIENPPLTLDVDIDAEATDVVRVLHDIVPYEGFRQELLQLHDLAGTGSGHLHLGHTQQDFDVHVNVAAMDVKGRYGRLASSFHIQKGTMQVEPHRVSWSGVIGTLGNHRVSNLTGSVDWEHEPLLRINNLDAAVDADTLLPDLTHYKVVASYLAPVLTSLSGDLQISGGTFEGPALDHEKWRYHAVATLKNVGWKSPLLDNAPVSGHSGEITLNDKEIKLARHEARFQKGSLTAEGTLRHRLLADWQGGIELSGSLAEEFGPWLRNQGWLPPVAQPRLPAKIKGVRLDWDDDKFTAVGTLIAGGVSLKAPPQLAFNITTSAQNPLTMALDVEEQNRHGRLQFDLLDQVPETFRLAWQGELRAPTLKRLIADGTLLTGAIEGDCTIAVPAEPARPSVTGQLTATGLRLPLDGTAAQLLDIRELNLSGSRGKAMVRRLVLALNEKEQLTLTGEVAAVPNGLQLALNLTSPHLTRKTADNFLDQIKRLRDLTAKPEKTDKKPAGRTITGTVHFTLDNFLSGPKDDEPADGAPLIWNPIKGILTLKPQGKMMAEIETAKLCCLNTKGTWLSDPAMGVSHYTLTTVCPTPPKFEEVLPCVGITQNVVLGEFNLNADLYGDPAFWHSGRATITSKKGRILRMRLLSKIFSVVNLTDLLLSDSDLPNFENKGFAYSDLILETRIKENELIIDKIVVRGEGLNLFARGKLNLGTRQADITLLIAPFKTIDAIVGNIPLVGRIFGGKESAIITIPVGIKGDIRDPAITVLAPNAVGEGLLNLVKNTLLLPFNILSPILPGATPDADQ